MKKFLALWVVIIVFGVLAGLTIGVVDYFFAETGTSSLGYPCWQSIFGECYSDRTTFLAIPSLFSLFITVPGYILVRILVGSFKVVF